MFAAMKAKYNSRSFRRFIENKFPRKCYGWFVRMQMRTQYTPNRLLVQA